MSMSKSKRKAPEAPAVTGMDMTEEASPKPRKTIGDLPPEVVTIILEHVTRNETRNIMLGYRLVNAQWKDIIGSLVEKKIISRQLPVFPGMRVLCSGGGHDLFHVRQSPALFPTGRNPFSSNSLVLSGNGDETHPKYFTQRMALPKFMSTVGVYLTTFALHDVIVPGMNSVVSLLSSMPNLKSLSFKDVTLNDRVIQPNVALLTRPTLPDLTTLEVKTDHNLGWYDPLRVNNRRHILNVWLIASYADQLVRLYLETEEPLPALQKGNRYSHLFEKENTLYIATTSDSGFENVTELQLYRVNKNFLRLSEFPRLKRLSVTGRDYDYNRDFQDVTVFISKCRNTLENLCIDVTWQELMGQEANNHFYREGTLPPSTICGLGSSCPKLNTLEIHYPENSDWYKDDAMISRFLALFPALKTLHFLRFPACHMASENEALDVAERRGTLANSIVTQLASLEQGFSERSTNFLQQRAALHRQGRNEMMRELRREMCQARTAVMNERDGILKQLAALGVKEQNAVVEQFLERQGIWNSCANLKVVSVSTGGKPAGDVCVIRRMDLTEKIRA